MIDGCVRDVAALEEHGFPVFSTGVSLPGATKELPGAAGGSAEVGEVRVQTGDWLMGDADGVTVVAATELEDVLTAGAARAKSEQALFAALTDGKTTVELLGLDPTPIDEGEDEE